MSSNSETILSANTHPGDSTSIIVSGSHFKGDGYYGRSDGLHTVQYDYVGLSGTISIQATLETTPTDDDKIMQIAWACRLVDLEENNLQPVPPAAYEA